jgi:Na+-driven multidrug efflux pump
LMTMTGNERSAAALLVGCAVVNVVVGWVLVRTLGVTGAAIASAASLIAWSVVMALFVWRALSLVPGALAHFGRKPVTG